MSEDVYQYERAIKYMFGHMDAEFWRKVVDEKLTPPLMLLEHVMAQRPYVTALAAESRNTKSTVSKGIHRE